MIVETECPHCQHVFRFDTDAVSRLAWVREAKGDVAEPHAYLPKCPKCLKEFEVPNTRQS